MTKPTLPSAGDKPNVVEIDAIDGAEWERDQHTPRAPTAGLAELVRQTLPRPIAAQPQPIAAQPQQRPAPASPGRAPQAPRPAAPLPRTPAAPKVAVIPPMKRAGAPGTPGEPGTPGTHDKPSAALPRVAPAAGNDRPTAHEVVRQITAQVRAAAPPASNTRPSRQPRVEAPEIDDRDIAPLRVPLLASDDRTSEPPRMSSLASDDRDMSQLRVSAFASTERITTPPQMSAETVMMRGPKPPRAPTANPSPMQPPMQPMQPMLPTLPVHIEAQRSPRAPSEPALAGQSMGHAASSLGTASLPVLSSIASSRGLMIIGGIGLTVFLLVIAFATSRGSAPAVTPATSETSTQTGQADQAGQATPTGQAAQASAPSHAPTDGDELSPPNPHTAADSAAPAVASPDSPAQPGASKPSAASSPSAPGLRRPAKITALSSAAQEMPAGTDDELPDTEKARSAYNAGNQALFQGHSDAAIQAYRQALSAAPTFPPGFRGLGLAYAQKGQNGLAIMSLRTYLSKAPHARDAALIKQRIAALMASDH